MPGLEALPCLTVAEVMVGGDHHRILLDGITLPPGLDAFGARELLATDHDGLRQLLLSPPLGTKDMCADLVFPLPETPDRYGFVIMECMGYPYFSGSNTMATAAALIECGLIPPKGESMCLQLEAPSGPVSVDCGLQNGRVTETTVGCDPAYVIEDGLSIDLPGFGRINYALVWSGANFIMVDAARAGLSVDSDHEPAIKRLGLALVDAIVPTFDHVHPTLGPTAPPGFVHVMGPATQTAPSRFDARGATFGHPDTLFRCPTGTGTAARLALEIARGIWPSDTVLTYTSAHDETFTGRALGPADLPGRRALAATVTAKPFIQAETKIHLDWSHPTFAEHRAIAPLITPG